MFEVKERQILFTYEMVRAILDGRKTVTRRVMRPQPPKNAQSCLMAADDSGDVKFFKDVVAHHVGLALTGWIKSPYGRRGDLLYVRETWRPGAWREDGRIAIDYKASPELTNTPWLTIPEDEHGEQFDDLWVKLSDELEAAGIEPDEDGKYNWEPGKSPLKWRPSIHMPKWAARIWLRVTAVRVERLQDIDNHDSWREGIPEYYVSTNGERNPAWDNLTPRNPDRFQEDGTYWPEARDVFAHLWDSINEKRGYSWDTNPFVWVVEFEVVEE